MRILGAGGPGLVASYFHGSPSRSAAPQSCDDAAPASAPNVALGDKLLCTNALVPVGSWPPSLMRFAGRSSPAMSPVGTGSVERKPTICIDLLGAMLSWIGYRLTRAPADIRLMGIAPGQAERNQRAVWDAGVAAFAAPVPWSWWWRWCNPRRGRTGIWDLEPGNSGDA